MKTFIAISLFSTLTFASTEDQILNHSVVKSIGKLMNDKHNGQCTLPTQASDIHWMCMGLISPVTVPTIEMTPSSCGFTMTISCPGEMASLTGMKKSYFLHLPHEHHTLVKPTAETITIDDIHFAESR